MTNPTNQLERPTRPTDKPIAVVGFGGNALIRQGQEGHIGEQHHNAATAVNALVALLERDYRILIVHGNGPQVGNELIRQEESATKVPPLPLDACVANTQGSMGFQLEAAVRNLARRHGRDVQVATLLTAVEVDPHDRAFQVPTKPVGPFLTRFRAQELQRLKGTPIVEDSGRGWRVVVPSPRPRRILNQPLVKDLLDRDYVVIAGGGGGIPVYTDADGGLCGVEAVIDKDFTSAMYASSVGAALFVVLTAVPRISIHFNSPQQSELDELRASELRGYLEAGHFPAGSMGPKVEAALQYLESGGTECLITTAERVAAGLAGHDGTRVLADDVERPSRQLAFEW